ncbi:MAG: Flp pilus assembly protein CpaB [Nocardioides sp.]|uniref:Flp pilus assembly protein CpaB n=1 Tax=Nocardioides sp. TaxID=35761 RepID=UPI003F048889
MTSVVPPPRPGRAWSRRGRLLRRRVLAHRRLLAAGCALVAVLCGARAVTPAPPPSVAVAVAVRDLAAGTTVGPDDLTTVRLPADAVPDGLAASPTGRVLAAPMRRGEPLTDVRLVSAQLTVGQPGATALPVRLPDAGMADLLAPGDVVDLLATDPRTGEARPVAHDVRVLAIPRDVSGASAGGSGAGSGVGSGAMVVLEVSASEAVTLTGAALSEYLTVAL